MTLRERRLEMGLTQEQAAKRLRVVQTAVSNWEIGRRNPDKKSQKKLARLYGCSVDDLLKGGD